MSLVKSNFMSVVKKQYIYKLKGYSKFFLTIIITQIIGMVFTLSNAGGNAATSNGIYSFNIERNSTIPVFLFTLFCIMGATIVLNLKEYKDMDFTFISNQNSSNLSNMAFLITLSLFGAVTSTLSGVLTRTIKYLFIGGSKIIESGFFLTPGEVMFSIGATFLYILLFSSAVYFGTVLTQKSNIFIIVILAIIILFPQNPMFKNILWFYGRESSFFIFALKVLMTCGVFFLGSLLVSNKLEVGR
jgi:hypothetical protein